MRANSLAVRLFLWATAWTVVILIATGIALFLVSRPIEVVVLNCWVTDTNETPWASNSSTSGSKLTIESL